MVTNSSKMTDFGAFSSTIEFGKRDRNLNKALERSRESLAGYRDSEGSGDDMHFSIR